MDVVLVYFYEGSETGGAVVNKAGKMRFSLVSLVYQRDVWVADYGGTKDFDRWGKECAISGDGSWRTFRHKGSLGVRGTRWGGAGATWTTSAAVRGITRGSSQAG